jgi:hypothetical protein
VAAEMSAALLRNPRLLSDMNGYLPAGMEPALVEKYEAGMRNVS